MQTALTLSRCWKKRENSLTIAGKTPLKRTILAIPNLAIRKLYAERIREARLPDFQSRKEAQRVSEILFGTGELQPVCDFMENTYLKAFDNRDYRWSNELTIKTAFLTLLFDDMVYIVDSETALERDYADLTLIVRPDMRDSQLQDILIEFKYIGLLELGLSGEAVREKSREELKLLAPVQRKCSEARSKLIRYREILTNKYGDTLRLHTFSVVALGFERLLWEKLA